MGTKIDHIEELRVELEDARWQLEIEAALEHIRAQAMAMESSEELVETARVTFEQLTSLGLSLSHDIVTKGHGGTMTVAKSADGGATFSIILPSGNIKFMRAKSFQID